jgi:hypothetical protein
LVAESECGFIHAEYYKRYSVAIVLPGQRAGCAQHHRTVTAQRVDIERKTRLDSALPYAAMSTGTATAHFTSPIFEINL